jgi:cellulose synthase/poly-beta-1,6-N-acetylglucosamine synthase-like glycosyltransferase
LFIPYAVVILLYRKWFLQLRPFALPAQPLPQTGFTIIIPARNEQENIAICVNAIMQQQYPQQLIEVIVIDDHSTDATALVVQQLQQQYSNLQLIKLADTLNGKKLNSYKKKAIENAIGHAAHEWIVTTDADCIATPQWLAAMDAYIQQTQSVFVAAPVIYTNDGSVVATFQYIDFMSMQGITAASVTAGFHSMCNGANLAYQKSVFYEVNGFRGIDNIASGDDMLLMNKIKAVYPKRIGFLYAPEAIVTTHPMPNWRSFFNQRIRWASKADQFKGKDKKVFAVLVLVYFYNLALFVMPVLAVFKPVLLVWWLVFIAAKTLVEMSFAIPVARFFGQPFIWWFPFLEPLHVAYIVISGWLGKFGSYQWKGRNVK